MKKKTHEQFSKAVSKVSAAIAAQLADLKDPVSGEQVIGVLKAQDCGTEILCAAFWSLDNQPAWHANYQVWHPRLRSVRNHPVYGEQLFALFRESD